MNKHYLICRNENCEQEACVDRRVYLATLKARDAEIVGWRARAKALEANERHIEQMMKERDTAIKERDDHEADARVAWNDHASMNRELTTAHARIKELEAQIEAVKKELGSIYNLFCTGGLKTHECFCEGERVCIPCRIVPIRARLSAPVENSNSEEGRK